MTTYVSQPVSVCGKTLWLDGNSKISLGEDGFENPRANAFSLPEIDSCPGATETCKAGCYVHRLAKAQPDLHAKYQENFDNVRWLLGHAFAESARRFGMEIRQRRLPGWRAHVSGDLFSEDYTAWICTVARYAATPGWIYTRSLNYLPILALLKPSYFVVNVSADRDNYATARDAAAKHGFRVCYMTQGPVPEDLPLGSVIFPDVQVRKNRPWLLTLPMRQRIRVCSSDYLGQSPKARCGPCSWCLK